MSLYLLIKHLNEKIFEHEHKRLRNIELDLVKQNTEAGGKPDGFRYNGRVFTHLSSSIVSRGKFGSVEASMLKAAAQYTEDANLIKYDEIRISQALTLVLNKLDRRQDMRDALPECLIDLTGFAKEYPRTRPEAYNLANNPRALNQYNILREKIEFYLASKMLY